MRILSKFCCLILALCGLLPSHAQTPLADRLEKFKSFRDSPIGFQDQLQEQYKLRKSAIAAGNEFLLARTYYTEMQIRDRLYEDSAFISNSLYIDSLLRIATNRPALELCIQLLKAQRIEVLHKKSKASRRKINLANPVPIRWHLMPYDSLHREIKEALYRAKMLSDKLRNTPIEDYLWLASDPLFSWFKPSLPTVVYGEGMYLLPSRISQSRSDTMPTWLKTSEFPINTELIADSSNYEMIGWHEEWMKENWFTEEEKQFHELQLAKNLYTHYSRTDIAREAYVEYMEAQLDNQYASVRAFAVFQSFLLHNKKGNEFNGSYTKKQDSSYKDEYRKAVQLYSEHKSLLDSFGLAKGIMLKALNTIQQPEYSTLQKEIFQPGETISFSVRIRNLDSLFIRIHKISARTNVPNSSEFEWNRFVDKEPFKDTVFYLVNKKDFNFLSHELSIGTLPPGNYSMLLSGTRFRKGIPVGEVSQLRVNNLALLQNDDVVFVLNRTTGHPITNASLLIEDKKSHYKVSTNKQGRARLREADETNILIVNNTDTITAVSDTRKYRYENDDIFTKEEYTNLLDFYEWTTTCHIYTDRSIYRPGQTVHYKGIILIRDKKTGAPLVLNWKNLQFDPFSKLYYKIHQLFAREKLELSINDPFNKTVDSSFVLPNKFGSFSGSFVIPENAATGEYSFDTYELDFDYSSSNSFLLEEYKRPSYEIKIREPNHLIEPGETLPVTIQLRSFSGAILNQVPITIEIKASGPNRNETLLKLDTLTNEKGDYYLSITDPGIIDWLQQQTDQSSMEYSVLASALTPTGERQEEEFSISVSNRPVKLRHTLPSKLDLAKPISFRITARHDKDLIQELAVQFKLVKIIGTESTIILDSIYKIGTDITLPVAKLDTGIYEIELFAWNGARLNGYYKTRLLAYNSTKKTYPATEGPFYETTLITEGTRQIQWMEGFSADSTYCIFHLRYKTKREKMVDYYRFIYQQKGLQYSNIMIPKEATGNLILTRIYIRNNEKTSTSERFYLPENKTNPEILLEKFRTNLEPGEQETFTVSIKTGNRSAVAELMTTLYDASLDKLEEHKWNLPSFNKPYLSDRWKTAINSINRLEKEIVPSLTFGKEKAFWWMPASYAATMVPNSDEDYFPVFNMLSGRVAGVHIQNTPGLNEVVVVGYGIKKSSLSASIIQIRGSTSLAAYSNLLIILDGVPYTGDLSKLNLSSIQNNLLLKGAEATALYGSRAANGVLLLSTNGPVKLPAPPTPPVVIRKNFNETAFFYPQLHADKKGMYHIRFRLPQTATEWKWKLLSHTKSARFSYLEKSIYSQLPLMVLPDLPRFLYQGDKIEIPTRIANLDTLPIDATLSCIIEQERTGKDLTSLFLAETTRTIRLEPKSTSYGKFQLAVPDTMLDPIRIRFIVKSSRFSDGEEHLIPILSRKQLVSQSVQVSAADAGSLIQAPALPSDAVPFGIGVSIPAQPQAALLYSLPSLANYQFICAEQTTNKLLAHLMAIEVVKKGMVLPRADKKNPLAPTVKLSNLPASVRSTAMPWLELAEKNQREQNALNELLDTSFSLSKAKKYLDDVLDMQLSSGALPWFKEGEPDFYISVYVMQSFGKMKDKGYLQLLRNYESEKVATFLSSLIKFCDNAASNELTDNQRSNYLYARSFFADTHPLPDSGFRTYKPILTERWQSANSYTISEQARLVTTTLRLFTPDDELYKRALKQLDIIRQAGVYEEGKGMRWKIISNEDELSHTQEELLALIHEAFLYEPSYQLYTKGILQWILQYRSHHDWGSTKAAAAMIYQLATEKYADSSGYSASSVTYQKQELTVSNNLLKGKLTEFQPVTGTAFSPVQTNPVTGKPTATLLQYYYFSNTVTNNSAAVLRSEKKLEKWNSETSNWEKMELPYRSKVGDKIRVTVHLNSSKPLQYLVLNDRHPATMEPVRSISGYQYGDGIRYYASVRDIGHHFFVSRLPLGETLIQYEMKITKAGSFTSGIYTIQAMYQPSIQTMGSAYTIEVSAE
jgi:TonB-dependent SusC/RagA subfamily outer membrane receptor